MHSQQEAIKWFLEQGEKINEWSQELLDTYLNSEKRTYEASKERGLEAWITPQKGLEMMIFHYEITLTRQLESEFNIDIDLILRFEFYRSLIAMLKNVIFSITKTRAIENVRNLMDKYKTDTISFEFKKDITYDKQLRFNPICVYTTKIENKEDNNKNTDTILFSFDKSMDNIDLYSFDIHFMLCYDEEVYEVKKV